ncbi:UNVERIFIED_CONTAM: hypothetical protein GTU68_000007 [Idotea baltica]|nr:hypothetical protein [Idotea baltica]
MDAERLEKLVAIAVDNHVDYFFVGGSLVTNNSAQTWIEQIKASCGIPVIIFPGSTYQISESADALFFLSLISGRNPDLLIGQQVISAPILKQMDLEIMSTGYMLIDGGQATTVSYITHSLPIPRDKPGIALSTALAGEMLGMKLIYMDSGSGATYSISDAMISTVSKAIEVPLIIGGGIRTAERAKQVCLAGADVIVVGTVLEKDPTLIKEMVEAVHSCSSSLA